jgi:hypothetical protein
VGAGTFEQFANTAATTLNNGGTVGSSDTSLTVTSAAAFPTTGNFRILIDSEILLVTAVSTNTFTVVRAQDGTSAATHADGGAVTHVLTRDALRALQKGKWRYTNTASAVYTCDSTGNAYDVLIYHNKSGAVSYVLPAATDGRSIEFVDITGAINTLANNVFLVPAANEKINTSSGFALTGTAYHFTNNSATVTATGSKFQSELAVGMSIQSSNQSGTNYIISAIASDTSLTLTAVFTGTTTTTATATRTSITWAANGGRLYADSDGTDWFIQGNGVPTILTWTASSGGTVAPFIPPQGVYNGIIGGYGGGGGGGSGGGNNGSGTDSGGAGGGGSLQEEITTTWSPLSNNAITVGAGGNGGGAAGGSTGSAGLPGADSSVGSLATFGGASGGMGANGSNASGGGLPVKLDSGTTTASNAYAYFANMGAGTTSLAQGGGGNTGATTGTHGVRNPIGYSGGTGGSGTSNSGGGGGGGGGPGGAGANGSNSVASSPTAGGSASANTGAGGGGSGCCTGGASAVGGTGGSGKVWVKYVL